jgi:hypothetical protein
VPKKLEDEYRIEERNKRFFVIHVGTAQRYGPYRSQIAAEGIVEALRLEATPLDPETAAKRLERAAYRYVDRDPILRVLKHILPRGDRTEQEKEKGKVSSTGEIARNTKRNETHMHSWMDSRVAIGSSDPPLHAELNKSPGQRKTARAAAARGMQGTSTREQVAERLKTLTDTPARKRAGQIAREMSLDPAYVRTIIRQLLK